MKENNAKRKLIGEVVSDKMQRTRVVAVSRLKKHPKYHRYYKTTTKLKAHDEENIYKKGERVVIEETRPLSRGKRWVIVSRVAVKNQPETEAKE